MRSEIPYAFAFGRHLTKSPAELLNGLALDLAYRQVAQKLYKTLDSCLVLTHGFLNVALFFAHVEIVARPLLEDPSEGLWVP